MDSVVPIRDKYVLNMYLLNPIPEKDWIVWIMMPIKPDTCLGVCNTPLPVRTQKMILIYRMNLKTGMCWGVCNTPLPIRDKYLINTYLLNPIPGKD